MERFDAFAPQWPALNVLLDEALALPVSAHADWLDALVGERAQHCEMLHLLLSFQASVESDDFLGHLPALDSRHGSVPKDSPVAGGRVGAYRLVREIARGGMATVWLAERADGLMQKGVALKLPRAVGGDDFAERVMREQRFLATLDHPHIARLDARLDSARLDVAGGALSGRPYLAMEYVDGEPIDVHCRSRSLSLRARLGLLLQVMGAVAHAHSKHIVHLDLKPGNILVTDAGEAKLLDFGIARRLEGDRTCGASSADAAGRALTPDYASPEQICGAPLGTTSDVYSLGVVAFELLAGAPPYRLKRGSAADVEEAIAATEPLRASDAAPCAQLRDSLRGDLDAILAKALKKPVDQRYQSVDAFARDIGRWLRDEPVQRGPDSRRHRAVGIRAAETWRALDPDGRGDPRPRRSLPAPRPDQPYRVASASFDADTPRQGGRAPQPSLAGTPR